MRAALVLLLLSGCATETKMYGADGNPYHFIECNGLAQTMSACYEKAAKICPAGYRMAGKEDYENGVVGGALEHSAALGTAVYRSITIACKA